MTGFDIFAIALVLLVVLTLFAGVKTVGQGYNWTVERFGKFTRILSPGPPEWLVQPGRISPGYPRGRPSKPCAWRR